MGRSNRAKSVVKCKCVCHRKQLHHCDVCKDGLVWLSDDWQTFANSIAKNGIGKIDGVTIKEQSNE